MSISSTSALGKAVTEKRKILREQYGGMMSVQDLMNEFGFKSKESALRAISDLGIQPTQLGRSRRYDTDLVAKRLVEIRGMC